MSVSPMARQIKSTEAIPIKRVLVNDPSEMPSCCSETPGGTAFSTTPGGTKILYEKRFLLNLRNSPISQTPPTNDIPENLIKGSSSPPKKNNNTHHYNYPRKQSLTNKGRRNSNARKGSIKEEDQFHIEL
ncbi:eukaryotic translation initiation factor 4E-binding protein [Euwallacea similis]|uniref:eukaryotic translation initiation factor 4E-binding protein n=1 Tax=Euwallacea similis TaxID=1736056 RepID=UPI00344D5DB7